jgi:hypothetical protein
VWGELNGPRVTIDAYRRNVQRSYLDIANSKLNAPPQTLPLGLPPGFAAIFITSGDEREYYRSELRTISAAAGAAIAKATDRGTKVHLESVRDQISKILNPEGSRTPGPAFNGANDLLELYLNPTSCWPDYIVRP